MQDTLKARLRRLHQLKEFGGEFNISLAERELSDTEVKVLREFYREDPLAHDVAKGRDSYRTRIEPIEEKYDSFWKRALAPRKDEPFNQVVMRVLGSMNSVGEAYISPEQFTTDSRRRSIWLDNGLSLSVGGLLGLMTGFVVYSTPESSGEFDAYTNAFVKSLPASVLVIPYGIFKTFHSLNMKGSLEYLRDATQKTDEFLRQHCV